MAADFEKAERTASSILRQYGLTKPPVDPMQIARREGISVCYEEFPNELADKVSGYFDPTKVTDLGTGAIVINVAISPSRMLFTIAHELGHVILHKHIRDSDRISSVQFRTNEWEKGNKPPEEQEADWFAAHLLMPENWVKKYSEILKDIGKEPTPGNLSRLFGVSSQAMSIRLKALHIG